MTRLDKRMAQRATELFKEDFSAIEKQVPDCFRTNPGGKMTPNRKKKVLEIIQRVERSKRSA